MLEKIWQNKLTVPLFFLLALIIRVYFVTFPAHPYDIGTYQAWGNIMLEKGPREFFISTWSDYLPFPVFFVAGIAKLTGLLQLSFAITFKLTVTIMEVILCYLLYVNLNHKRKYLLLPLLLLSPALIGDSAFWGQLDTLPALFGVLSLVLTLKPKHQHLSAKLLPGLFFGLAISFKPIMLLLVPVLLIVGYKQKILWSNLVVSALVFLLTSFPAAPGVELFDFLKSKTLEQASTYPFRTINAFNFWNINNPLNLWPPDSASAFGISAHTAGLFLFFLLTFLVLKSWYQNKLSLNSSYQIAGLIFLLFYTFTTRMHERHLFFALPFLALTILENRRFAIPYILLTACFTLNLWGAYYWVMHDQTWPFSYLVTQLASWLTALSALFLLIPKTFWTNIKSWISSNKYLIIILLLASLLRLINLGNPPDYIFDEVYHAFTAREYINNHIEAWEWWTNPPEGVAYEWTHPPFAKYGMALGMWIFGENAFGWRIFSGVAGVISIFGLYTLVEQLFKDKRIALLAALLASLEGLHLSQSRIAMNDMYMLAFFTWSLVLAAKNNFKGAAILYGLALSSKWSALYGVIPLSYIYAHHHFFPFTNWSKLLKEILSALRYPIIAILVYLLAFTPFLLVGHTFDQFIELHRQMWYYHTHLVATHAYQSVPWQWILSLRPVWYYVNYGDHIANIYAQGNPAILWLGLVALILLLENLLKFRYALLILLYFVFTAPWIVSPRIMFFYHYLPSAFFLTGILAVWLTSLEKKYQYLVIIFILLAFLLLSPVYFGINMPGKYWDTLFAIFPSWK